MAFDTVDSEMLRLKLDHYEVHSKELSIMGSFLTNRQQYVSIDRMESELLNSPQCSVVQDSKMSSLLYILFTNEIPLLSKIMRNPILKELTGPNPIDINTDIYPNTENCN